MEEVCRRISVSLQWPTHSLRALGQQGEWYSQGTFALALDFLSIYVRVSELL